MCILGAFGGSWLYKLCSVCVLRLSARRLFASLSLTFSPPDGGERVHSTQEDVRSGGGRRSANGWPAGRETGQERRRTGFYFYTAYGRGYPYLFFQRSLNVR